jgi:phosphatidylserine/phosphatidylglycerophosphate/cardiolipin synthase-like enzyme
VTDLEFLYDLTYQRDGERVVEQQIFDRVMRMIDEAERFVILDMFLFNDEHGGDRAYIPLTRTLTDRLVRKRSQSPDVYISVTTDEINTFYGAYMPYQFTALERAGVDLVVTDLTKLRDSNAMYSAVWRVFLRWFGTAGPAFFPHPLTSRGQKVTARSYLRLFNMKANHRKLIVTDKECLVASANPHDASSYHSNIAWVANGEICNDMLQSERGVADFSGVVLPEHVVEGSDGEDGDVQVRFLTEGKIRSALIEAMQQAGQGDSIDVAMFYFSDRGVVRALRGASSRGVAIRLVLDPNKDAFGREKGGIPNRQVAYELREPNYAAIRWYDTHGEQFHTKLVVIRRTDEVTMFGGSANLTRRNLQDLNLEADLEVVVPRGHPLDLRVSSYFERIWNNEGGHHTVEYEAYRDGSWFKTAVYRVQELTGLCSY